MSDGKKWKLTISDNGTPTGTMIEVESQGDLQINPGKTVAPTVYKNAQKATHNDAGFSITLNIGMVAPTPTGQGLLLALNDSEAESYFELQNALTGGVEYHFDGKVAIQNINSPINGDNIMAVQIVAEGSVTRVSAS